MKERNRGVSAQLNSSHSSVTQPVGQNRNARRVQQIEALHMQFEDLKKKIRDVENKNERIIQNIHKRYDFKKKPQTMEYMVEKTPIVYYEHQQDKSQVSAENQSCNSNQSQCQFKIAKPKPKKTSSIKRNANPGHQSLEFRKTEQNIEERQTSQLGSNKSGFNPPVKQMSSGPQFNYGAPSYSRNQNSPSEQYPINQFQGVHPYQMSMQFPAYPSMAYSQPDSFFNNTYQLQQNLRRQRQKIKILQQELQEKQNDTVVLKRLQKKMNSLSMTYSEVVEASLQEFMEEVVKKRMYEIEKYVRKNQNKLRRLHLMIKDRNEETRSARNISEHRRKRSSSKNKRQYSPVNHNYTSVPRGPRKTVSTQQQLSVQGETSSASKSRQSDQMKSNIKFEQIANQYEEMIKVKNKELETFEGKLKQKEKELIQMGAKCAQLQLRLSEAQETPKYPRRISSDRDDNLLANLDFQTEKDIQIKQLNKRVGQLEDQAKKKQLQLRDKDANIEKLTKKSGDLQTRSRKYEAETKKLKEQLKRIEILSREQTELQVKLRRLQAELQAKEKEFNVSKEKYVRLESQKIERECQYMTLNNKVKKIELLLTVKEEKIQELEKIIQSNAGSEVPDLLDKSVFLEKIQQNEMHRLQQEKEQAEEENLKKDEELFTLRKNYELLSAKLQEFAGENQNLKKEAQALQIQIESTKINMKAMEFQKYSAKNDSRSPLQKLLDENECISENDDNSAVREELQEMRNKYEESQRQLKIQKHQSLQFNTKLIKINSQLTYYKELLSERQGKYQKLRREFEEGRIQINELQQLLQDKDNQLELEKKMNSERIMELETQWLQFQEQMRNKDQGQGTQNISDLKSSRNFSEDSFVGYKNTFNSINAQNEHLNEKLKEAEKIIEIQKQMEEKIMSEYRANVDKIKAELRDKVKLTESLQEELENLRRKVKVLEKNELRLKEMAERGDKDLLGETNSKVYVLEMELAQLKELKAKQQAVEQQIFKQITQKQQENESLVRLISVKERKIEELEDLLELKEMQIPSNISTSQNKSKIKESLQSNSSLRYSMLSNTHNRDRTIDFDLSEAGESFYQHNQSIISNVSEVFGRDEFPYEKMQLKRVQQRRLFQKTAAYIKSLKNAIDEKNKKIKLLEKKIESLRNSELIRKDLFEIKEIIDLEPDDQDIFKDYYSVQNHSSSSQRYKLKQLEHETKLTIEENNLLINQIESMQDELLKAEEQEASLMKLKDLYKDEIKNLIKKNQEQSKSFEDEIKRERQKVEQNQSVQKMEALKQLFVKIINLVILIDHEGPKAKKREEHKKELEEFTKVFCNFLSLEEAAREKILADLRR